MAKKSAKNMAKKKAKKPVKKVSRPVAKKVSKPAPKKLAKKVSKKVASKAVVKLVKKVPRQRIHTGELVYKSTDGRPQIKPQPNFSSPRPQSNTPIYNENQIKLIKAVAFFSNSAGNIKIKFPDYYYKSIYDIVEKEGEFSTKSIFDKHEEAIIEKVFSIIKNQIKLKQSFYNSQIATLFDSSNMLKYHEGFIIGEFGFPITHGWNTLNGKVVDFTTDKLDKKFKNVENDREYFGIDVEKKWVMDRFENNTTSTSYLDNPHEEFPALKHKHRKSVFVKGE